MKAVDGGRPASAKCQSSPAVTVTDLVNSAKSREPALGACGRVFPLWVAVDLAAFWLVVSLAASARCAGLNFLAAGGGPELAALAAAAALR